MSSKSLIQKLFRRERWVKTNQREFDRYDKSNRQEEVIDASNKIQRVLRSVKRRLDRSFGFAVEAKLPPMSTRQKVDVERVSYLSGQAIQISFAQAELDYEGYALGDIVVFLNGSLKGQNLAVVNIPDSSTLLLEDSDSGSEAAVAASFSGQVAGMTTDVTITADNAGAAGNSVSLAFDGSDDIDTAILDWNTANPSNTITLTAGDGSQIPDNAEEIDLADGADAQPLDQSNITVRININGSKRSYV